MISLIGLGFESLFNVLTGFLWRLLVWQAYT